MRHTCYFPAPGFWAAVVEEERPNGTARTFVCPHEHETEAAAETCGQEWTPMKVLVCGARFWADNRLPDDTPDEARNQAERDHLYRVLDALEPAPVLVIHGAAKGADTMAGEWAAERGVAVAVFPAQWDRYGRGAGPVRNRQMLTEGEPGLVVAFHADLTASKGTADMVRQAEKAGVPVRAETGRP